MKYLILLIFSIFSPLLRAADPAGDVRILRQSLTPADSLLIVEFTLCFDDVELGSNDMRVYIPTIAGRNGEEQELPAVLLTSRRQHYVYLRQGNRQYPGATELRRTNGTPQALAYRQTVSLQPWMRGGTLRIGIDDCGCGNVIAHRALQEPIGQIPHDVRKILAGVRIDAIKPHFPQTVKTYALEGRAFLDFRVGRTEIDATYRNNPEELRKIMQTIDIVRTDTNATITSVSIHGYASPEGSYAGNALLAAGRAEALKEYVRRLCQMDDALFHVESTAEDWAGLDSIVSASALAEREELLQMVRSDLDPDSRNDAIRQRWPELYRDVMLPEWYPALRHSDYIVGYTVRSFTTADEALRVYRTKPHQLSLAELYMVVAAYPDGSRQQQEVVVAAARRFPENAEANLAAAILLLNAKDYSGASSFLARAGFSPAAQHARGVLALLQGDYAQAEPLLQAAADAQEPHAAENLEALRMLK